MKPFKASAMERVFVRAVRVVPMSTTAPMGSGCAISPMMVAKKMAKRCQALMSTPAGAGRSQMTTAARTVIAPRITRFFLGSLALIVSSFHGRPVFGYAPGSVREQCRIYEPIPSGNLGSP